MLSAITRSARWKNVLDQIRSAKRQRYAVVRLEWTHRTAISARELKLKNEIGPLPRRVLAGRPGRPRAPNLIDHPTDFRVTLAVALAAGVGRLGMGRVIGVSRDLVLLRMPLAPASHCFPRLFRIALHPIAPVFATSFEISVRHGD